MWLVQVRAKLGNKSLARSEKKKSTRKRKKEITIYVPKSDVGNPPVGDLLGAIGAKTITGDTPATKTLERSTTLVDHTFIKGNSDNSYPAATYMVMGNNLCP